MIIEKVTFPANQRYRYYNLHYKFVADTIKANGFDFSLTSQLKEVNSAGFEVELNEEKKILFDFSDFTGIVPSYNKYSHCFKFHYVKPLHYKHKSLYPFSPISFYNWNEYYSLKQELSYSFGETIVNKQRAYAGAKERRIKVKYLLKKHYNKVDTSLSPPRLA